MSSLMEVLEYGPIIYPTFQDVQEVEHWESFVTVNGAYLNFWTSDGQGGFTNTECRYYDRNLWDVTVSQAMEAAQSFFEDLMGEDDEEEDEAGDED